MNLEEAKELAWQELEKYETRGLAGWRFEWRYYTTIFGQCDYREKIIILSEPLVIRNERDEVLDTIRHEIAHALSYIHSGHAGHGDLWKQWCIITGAKPIRCYTPDHMGGNVISVKPLQPRRRRWRGFNK